MSRLQRLTKIIDWLIFDGRIKTRRELSDILGYKESSFSQIMTGKVSVSNKFIKKLCKFDERINEDWILTGEGEMLKKNTLEEPVKSYSNPTLSELAEAVKILADSNKMMSESTRIIADANKILSENNKTLLEVNKTLSDTNTKLAKKISSLKEDIVEAVAVRCVAAEK